MNSLYCYASWPSPTVIISDGPYGLRLFSGDTDEPHTLPQWYEPHIRAWSEKASPQTTLWFWCSEIGWAQVHPLFEKYGWKYVHVNIWNKGIAHAAGNSNTKTLRQFPVVSEICVQYVRDVKINNLTLKDWLRNEWRRSGLPFSDANKACGVKNAATRKYLTADHLWYFPPPREFELLATYANKHGKSEGRPYFSVDGIRHLTAEEWASYRSKFHCEIGTTNVWNVPPLNGKERIKAAGKSLHLNQKPLELFELIIKASSSIGDVIWEPFGGLCTAALASYKLERKCFSAELNKRFYNIAVRRLYNARR
ncbi:MAG: site-specific DNA-methyltransferase [Candidatus Thermoplasmatota archaeon]|nr:site-specific DNA-methyltransferase [Candidatus Thermoplasmatota archaeon]